MSGLTGDELAARQGRLPIADDARPREVLASAEVAELAAGVADSSRSARSACAVWPSR